MIAGAVAALAMGAAIASGWIRWAFERAARKDAELATAQARRDTEAAKAELADRNERLGLYAKQLVAYRRQVRELPELARNLGPDAVRAAVNRLLSDKDSHEAGPGAGGVPGGDGGGTAADAYTGELR